MDDMLRRMSWPQFLQWVEFDKVEPIGGKRGDWQAAAICSAIMNGLSMAHQWEKDGSPLRFTPKDYMLEWREAKPEDKDAARKANSMKMKMIAKMMVAASNAPKRVTKKRKAWKK